MAKRPTLPDADAYRTKMQPHVDVILERAREAMDKNDGLCLLSDKGCRVSLTKSQVPAAREAAHQLNGQGFTARVVKEPLIGYEEHYLGMDMFFRPKHAHGPPIVYDHLRYMEIRLATQDVTASPAQPRQRS